MGVKLTLIFKSRAQNQTDRVVLCIVSMAVHSKVAGVDTIFAAYNKSNEVNYEHNVYLE